MSVIGSVDDPNLYLDTTNKTVAPKNNNMDKEMFLNLLVTQMKYQDPLDPMDNSAMLAQLAQFSALEQMQNVADTTEKQTAFSMIGKTVMGNLYNENDGISETIAGLVEAVSIKNGSLYLVVGDYELPYENVSIITDEYMYALSTINNNVAANQGLNLIGKNIQAVTLDNDGNLSEFIEGEVDYIKIVDGATVLVVNGKEIYASEVISVSGNKLLLGSAIEATYMDSTNTLITDVGTITGIKFINNETYVTITGTNYPSGHDYPVEKVVDLIDASVLFGRNVDTPSATGEVVGTVLNSGVVYLKVETAPGVYSEVSLDEIRENESTVK